ncbi:hypothetical protein NDA03_25925 [Trichocoleus sp. Lan]
MELLPVFPRLVSPLISETQEGKNVGPWKQENMGATYRAIAEKLGISEG